MKLSGSIAQWLEQETHNFLAGGSNPSRPTIFKISPFKVSKTLNGKAIRGV